MLVERQLHYKIQSQANALEAFHKKVKERLKISRRETTMGSTIIPAPNIVVERHKSESDHLTDVRSEQDDDVTVTRGNNDRSTAYKNLLSVSNYHSSDDYSTTNISLHHPETNRLAVMKTQVVTQHPSHVHKLPKFIPQDCLKMAKKKEIAAQHLAVRRMYSAIERQQSRVNAQQRQQQLSVEKLREEREEVRNLIEKDEGDSDYEEPSEEKERWLEMVVLERRHQKLMKQKEMDRYCEALHHQLKEKLPDLPSLCPCHPSLWQSDPYLCARNCQFYQNYTKFASALHSLLESLD